MVETSFFDRLNIRGLLIGLIFLSIGIYITIQYTDYTAKFIHHENTIFQDSSHRPSVINLVPPKEEKIVSPPEIPVSN